MSFKTCKVCDIVCPDENSYKAHVKGKKHLKIVESIERIQSLGERSIFVGEIPTYFLRSGNSKNFIAFFEQFGEVINYKLGAQHVIVEFQTSEPVKYLLSNDIYYNNLRLNINKRIIKYDPFKSKQKTENKPVKAINNTEELDYKNIKQIFEKDVSFDKQLLEFLNAVSIDEKEINTRYESTRSSLENILRNRHPNCKAYRFGSTLSGLGFKNCDLDIYLETDSSFLKNRNSPSFSKTTTAFLDVKRTLYSKSHLFSNIVPIPKAKTPIIKFVFVQTNISIDLSFKNILAVHNSKLIKYLLSKDEKLRSTMMVLKYWVCNYELQQGGKMSKYALTLLFIFYCQQPSVKLLPTIIELKAKVKPEMVEGWQVNFNNQDINMNSSNPSIPELLFGFFDFYANYDFKSKVVCPIDGMSHEKIILNSVETLPDSMNLYKDYLKTRESALTFPLTKPMCVQDPIELNHNVTGNIEFKYLKSFQKYCEKAAALCKTEAANDYKRLLSSIFELKVNIPRKIKSELTFFFYANSLIKVGLPDDFDTCTDIQNKNSLATEHWMDLVLELTQIYLKQVLKLQIQLVDEQELKQQKIEAESDVHKNDKNKVIMHCVGGTCMWRNRKGCGTSIDPSLSLLEKEIHITETVYKVLASKNRIQDGIIDFECNILKKLTKNPHVIFILSNIDGDKEIFNEMAPFIKSKLILILEKTLLHMKQYNKKLIDFKFNEQVTE